MVVSFNNETIRIINFFENYTGVRVKDCIIDENNNTVYFIVEEGKIGLAIGKSGRTIKNLEKKINKKIRVFEFSPDLANFTKKLIPKSKSIKIKNDGDKILVEVEVDKNDKPNIIGRNKRNIKTYRMILSRFFEVSDLIIK